jgi:urea carboxylase-associated protein 1
LYSAEDPGERYSVPDTISQSGNAYVRTGTVLRSNYGNALATVVANEIDKQDTIGGACGKESNTLRYGHHTMAEHGCRENFLAEAAKYGMGARDIVSNLNWFMNVPIEADGTLGIVDGISGPGKRVAFRAAMDILVLVSNCPQMNNPCNDFNPTPLRMIITAEPGRGGA